MNRDSAKAPDCWVKSQQNELTEMDRFKLKILDRRIVSCAGWERGKLFFSLSTLWGGLGSDSTIVKDFGKAKS